MKTLRHLSILLVLVCSTILVKAQCGIDAGFYQDLNPNQVPWFHDTTYVNSGWQITNQYWSFGDGATSAQTNPTHQFPHPGAYNVCHYVIASDNNGNTCTDTVCKLLQIGCTNMVQAAISANVQNNLVVFTGTGSSNYPPLTYYWQFPGGTPSVSTTAVTTVSYTNSGAHPAYLTVTDSNGCSTTVTQTVTTGNPCSNITVNFSTTIAGQAGTTVYMNSTSTGTNTNTLYQWTIDGATMTNPTPNTGYVVNNLSPGTHTICLGVYANGTYLCDTLCKTITITGCNTNIDAQFSYSITGNTVHFEPLLSLANQQTIWNFGDGGTSTDTGTFSIYHTYPCTANPTTYNVCHYISIANSTCRDTTCHAIVIQGSNTCCGEVNFSSTQNQGATILTATSTGSGNQYYTWKIKNTQGTTVLTGSSNPFTTTSLNAGTYTACVFLYNSNQQLCDSLCQTITIANTACSVPAYFSSTLTGNKLELYAVGNYPSGTWFKWSLDGQFTTTSASNFIYNYTNLASGTHNVCLYVMGNQGTVFCDSTCRTVTVANAVCTSIQPNAAQGKDAIISTIDVNTGDGTTPNLASMQWTNNTVPFELRSLLQLDLSAIPAGSTVTSAGLSLYANNTSTFGYTGQPTYGTANATNLKLVYGPWTENGVNWNNQPNVSNTGTLLAQSSNTNQSYTGIDVKTYAQYWLNNPTLNYGLMLDMVGTNFYNSMIFGSSDHPDSTKRPKLEICYVPNVCQPLQVFIYDTVQNNGSHMLTARVYNNISNEYAWNNGALTQQQTVTGGTYCVTVTNQYGCTGTACYTVGNTPCGQVTFTTSQAPNTLTLTAAATTTGNSFVWRIRNMNGVVVEDGTGSPISFSGLANGTYNICISMYNNTQQLCDSVCSTIAYTNMPCNSTASISAGSNGNGAYVLEAHISSTVVTGYAWSNGATTPTITTTVPGTYCVTVTGDNNCSASACYTITANCGTVAFSSVQTGEHLVLTATSTTTNNNFVWAIRNSNGQGVQTGSGNPFTSMALTNGSYQVCVYMYSNNQQLCDSACETIAVTNINPCTGLNAEWTPSYVNGNGVQFIPVGNPSGTVHIWSFGDGGSSTNADPTHYYLNNGLYNVCHIVSIPGTLCADTFCYSIQANAGNPCSGFTININHTVNNNGVHRLQAVATGSGSPFTYLWSNNATTQVIETTSPNVYCVTVYNASQCSATDCDTVTINTSTCNALYSYTYVNCNTVQFANASTGGYTNQVWQFGDGTSSSAANPVHSFPAGTWTVQLTVYSSGTNCQSSYYQVITVQPCGVYDTICGVVFNDINGNGVQDNGEQGLGGGTIHAGNYTATVNANGEYHVVLPTGTYTVYYCAPTGYSFTIPVGTQNPNSNTTNCASYTIATSGGHHCGYNFGVQNNSVNICGVVYLDANNNQQRENTEPGIANTHITLASNNGQTYHAYTNQNGEYCVTVPAGTYVITAITNIGGVVTPQSISLATVNGGAYYHNNFGVYQQPGACNLGITITPHTTVTPGFAAWYDVRVCNVGASVSSGTVNLFYDPTLIFNSSSPAQTSVNTSTHTISWALNNLAPGGCASYWVTFSAATNTQVGQHVFMLANVTTTNCNEVDYTNNVDTTHQNATASWDPNNKLVLPAGDGEEGIIKGTEELTYTINFQNTGNAPAVNVVLRDLIDTDLDLETFRMLGGSHPYTVQFEGREAIWKFNAIMLPDSNTNETESHGHVSFAIKPLAGLAEGTKLNNTADIYFDYNEAVTTNTTLNTIDYKLGTTDLNNQVTITLMPNPFKDYTTIRIEGENSTYQLRIFDMLGQQVQHETTTNNVFTIERGTLAGGMYMYEVVKNNKVIGKGKMIAAE